MKTKSKKQNGKPGKSQLNAPTTEAWLRRISGAGQPVKPGNGARVMTDWEDENGNNVPMLLLPLTEAAHEARVDKAHAAIAADPDYKNIAHHQWLDLIHTVLRAIGDVPVKMESGK